MIGWEDRMELLVILMGIHLGHLLNAYLGFLMVLASEYLLDSWMLSLLDAS